MIPALSKVATAAKASILPHPESLLGIVVLSGTAVEVMRKRVWVTLRVGLTERIKAMRPVT
jgi:hypothetical protein